MTKKSYLMMYVMGSPITDGMSYRMVKGMNYLTMYVVNYLMMYVMNYLMMYGMRDSEDCRLFDSRLLQQEVLYL